MEQPSEHARDQCGHDNPVTQDCVGATASQEQLTTQVESQEVEAQLGHYLEIEKQFDQLLALMTPSPDVDTGCAQVLNRMRQKMQRFVLASPESRASSREKQRPEVGGHYHARHRKFSTDSGSSLSISTDSSSSSGSPLVRRRRSRGGTNRSHGMTEPASGSFVTTELLKCLDNRTAPKPEPYDPQSGRHLREFLEEFESYCASAYKGSSSNWIGELAKFLKGEALQAYKAYRALPDTYEDLKKKLLRWHKRGDQKRKDSHKKLFAKAAREPGEPVRLFAPRLCNLFQLAYPKKRVQTSTTLRDKFLNSIPRTYKKQIQNAQNITHMTGRSKLKWSQIESLVTNIDEELTTEVPTDVPLAAETYRSSVPTRNHTDPGRVATRTYTNQNRRRGSTPSPTSGSLQHEHSPPGGRSHPPISSQPPPRCSWCNYIGHVRQTCRRYNNLCLACGSRKHSVGSCPFSYRNRRRDPRSRSPPQQTTPHTGYSQRPAYRPTVSFTPQVPERAPPTVETVPGPAHGEREVPPAFQDPAPPEQLQPLNG